MSLKWEQGSRGSHAPSKPQGKLPEVTLCGALYVEGPSHASLSADTGWRDENHDGPGLGWALQGALGTAARSHLSPGGSHMGLWLAGATWAVWGRDAGRRSQGSGLQGVRPWLQRGKGVLQ